MKLLVINGGPRKFCNTATLLKKAIEGAEANGADTEQINLYDINFKGCASCFSCKRIGGESYGRCALKDELTPVLKKFEECDALLLGSPVYLYDVTGEIKSFIERLVFPYLVYDKAHSSLFNKKIKTGLIYTMGSGEDMLDKFKEHFRVMEETVRVIFGEIEPLYVADTYQFDDYSKYVSDMFDEASKTKRHKEVFPEDCKKAYEMGTRLVK